MFEEVVCTAVNGLGSNDVLAGLCQVLDSVSDSSCAGSFNTALKSSDPLLEDVLSGVGKSAVDVACVLEAETVCCVLGVMENIGRSSVDRYCSCVSSGVCVLLSDMKLLGFKLKISSCKITHFKYLLINQVSVYITLNVRIFLFKAHISCTFVWYI